MKKQLTFSILLFLITNIALVAAQSSETTSSGGGIDWFNVIIAGSYLIGVFILLPLVIYTNMNEKIFNPETDDKAKVQILNELSEEERNNRAKDILEKIGEKLTPFKSDEGEELITITKGSQATFMKRGLDYIQKRLAPTDPELLARMEEFSEVYEHRAKRAFTGSNWVLACSAGVGLLFLWAGGITTFIFIHFLGLLFYFLSSRTTFYGIEKRIGYFGGGVGLISGIMGGLFLGNGVKQYVKQGNGPWQRDWQGEGETAIIGLMILLFVAIFLGIFAVFLGVLNFVINYSTSFLNPLKTEDKWYEENFVQAVE